MCEFIAACVGSGLISQPDPCNTTPVRHWAHLAPLCVSSDGVQMSCYSITHTPVKMVRCQEQCTQTIKNAIQKIEHMTNTNPKKGFIVKDLRIIIHLLIRVIFFPEEDHEKVKGMWEHCPANWNTTVPYLDPNNKPKPQKEILMKMFDYLWKLYLQETCPIIQTEGSVQVTDGIDGSCPYNDCQERIESKLCFIQKYRYLTNDENDMLSKTKDKLFDQFGQQECILQAQEYGHSFECTLDIVKATKKLPPKFNQKWCKFAGRKRDTISRQPSLDKHVVVIQENQELLHVECTSPPHTLIMSSEEDVCSVEVNLDVDKVMCNHDPYMSENNETKFADAEDIIAKDGMCLNETVAENDDNDDNGSNDGNVLNTTTGPDLSHYLTKNIDCELAGDDGALDTQTQGNICENVHTPRCDDKGYEEGASIQCRECKNSMESIDSDHSYVRKTDVVPENTSPWSVQSPTNNICDQVEQLSIPSPNVETTVLEERGTKRGYSDTRNDFEPKHRRTEDMDTWEDEGGTSSHNELITQMVE